MGRGLDRPWHDWRVFIGRTIRPNYRRFNPDSRDASATESPWLPWVFRVEGLPLSPAHRRSPTLILNNPSGDVGNGKRPIICQLIERRVAKLQPVWLNVAIGHKEL